MGSDVFLTGGDLGGDVSSVDSAEQHDTTTQREEQIEVLEANRPITESLRKSMNYPDIYTNR
jgi:hypothetical protein